MANLKDLKNRIRSVKSTQKITSAMKLVAAAKLRRAQANAESARPYAGRMRAMVARLAGTIDKNTAPALLVGTGKDTHHLLVVVSADRGLCGGFNGGIIRSVRRAVARFEGEGKTVQLLMVGRKAADALRREFGHLFIEVIEGVQGTNVDYADALRISTTIQDRLGEGNPGSETLDSCSIVFNRFVSAITQEVTNISLIPAEVDESVRDEQTPQTLPQAVTEYEPNEEGVLAALLPRALTTQIFAAILESSAAELAARMTAMDNATRNAGDLIDRLTMQYNRTRQAAITTELIEIISGAEAL